MFCPFPFSLPVSSAAPTFLSFPQPRDCHLPHHSTLYVTLFPPPTPVCPSSNLLCSPPSLSPSLSCHAEQSGSRQPRPIDYLKKFGVSSRTAAAVPSRHPQALRDLGGEGPLTLPLSSLGGTTRCSLSTRHSAHTWNHTPAPGAWVIIPDYHHRKSWYLSRYRHLSLKQRMLADMVAHTCHPSFREAETGGWQAKGQPGLVNVTLSQNK